MSTKTLAALKELSSDGHALIDERADKRGRVGLVLADSLLAVPDDGFDSAARAAIKRAVLRPTVGGLPNQFVDVMAWMSWLPACSMPEDHAAFKLRLAASGLDLDAYGLGNDQRWDNVIYWGRFTGLLWQRTREACAGVVADATTFLREATNVIFASNSTLQVHEFRTRLGEACSALDGGASSTRIASVMASRQVIGDDHETRLSPSVCLALRTLKQAGALDYGCPDDQRKFLLMTGNEKISFVSRGSATP
ncbi:hypothetical protein [Anaeromyxobacter paludicola]|nr:hypothetical protein [Anaeromyxobacter paludicola]